MKTQNWLGLGILIIAIAAIAYFIGQSSNNQPPSTNTAVVSATATQAATPSPSPTVQNQPDQTSPPQPTYNAPRYYTPMTFSANAEAQRSSFVNGCTSSGGTWGKCNCDFDYMIENHGVIWLIDENAYVNVNGAASPEYRAAAEQAAQSCSVWSN